MVVPFAKVLFFSETLVVLYVKNNKILIFLIEYERDKDIMNNYLVFSLTSSLRHPKIRLILDKEFHTFIFTFHHYRGQIDVTDRSKGYDDK